MSLSSPALPSVSYSQHFSRLFLAQCDSKEKQESRREGCEGQIPNPGVADAEGKLRNSTTQNARHVAKKKSNKDIHAAVKILLIINSLKDVKNEATFMGSMRHL